MFRPHAAFAAAVGDRHVRRILHQEDSYAEPAGMGRLRRSRHS